MRLLIVILFILPALAFAGDTTITNNGSVLTTTCSEGKGRVSIMDGGGGYDTGVVTLQYQTSAGDWETVCPTATDCQWSSGDSGAVGFDLGAKATVRLTTASVAGAAADIDVEVVCLK